VTLWIFPGAVALFAGTDSSLYTNVSGRLNEGIVAVLGASLLFVEPKRQSADAAGRGGQRKGDTDAKLWLQELNP
jgi:hypothetical protein